MIPPMVGLSGMKVTVLGVVGPVRAPLELEVLGLGTLDPSGSTSSSSGSLSNPSESLDLGELKVRSSSWNCTSSSGRVSSIFKISSLLLIVVVVHCVLVGSSLFQVGSCGAVSLLIRASPDRSVERYRLVLGSYTCQDILT